MCLPLILRHEAIPEALFVEVCGEIHWAQWKDVVLDIQRQRQRMILRRALTEMMETHFDMPSLVCGICGITDDDCSCRMIFMEATNM